MLDHRVISGSLLTHTFNLLTHTLNVQIQRYDG